MLPRLEEFLCIIICRVMAEQITASIRTKSPEIENLLTKKRNSTKRFSKSMASLKEKIDKELDDNLAALQQKRDQESTENSEHLAKYKEAVRKRLNTIIKYLNSELNPSEDTKQKTPNATKYSTDEMLAIIHEVLLLMEIPLEVVERLVDELKQVHEAVQTIQSSNNIKGYLVIFDDVEKKTITQHILESLRKGMSTIDIVLDQQLKTVHYAFFNLVLLLFCNFLQIICRLRFRST